MILGFLSPFLNMVILLGALQGFIFCTLLFSSAKSRLANRFLAWLLFLVSLASLKLFMSLKGWFSLPGMQFVDAIVPMIVPMPMGPLIYFYVKSSLDPGYRFRRKDSLHFLSTIIDLVPNLAALFFIVGVLTGTLKNRPGPWGLFIDDWNVYADIPRWLSISIYIWLASRQLRSAAPAAPATSATRQPAPLAMATRQFAAPGVHSPAHKWLRQLIYLFLVFQGVWLLYLIPYVIPKYTDFMLGRLGWYPVYVPLAVLIYWLGIKGYLVSAMAVSKAAKAGQKSEAQSVLEPALVEKTVSSLLSAMEDEKLYLDPALTVTLLAEHTRIGQKTISAVLNQHMHKSFNEFVNEYRITAIKHRLLNGDSQHLTIAGIAYDGGFNSLPTFQRAFKSILGQTPKEFLAANADHIRI